MKLLKKELRLALSIITPLFLAFTLMAFIPGYPILMGAFFVCFGIFQSFQTARESGDILYSALLPIPKREVVTAKFTVTVFFQLIAFGLLAVFTAIRMTALGGAMVYRTNALMSANLTFLAFVMLIFTAFNLLFLRGFFRTAYYYGKPFVAFIIAAMVITGIAETLHHLPGLGWLSDISGHGVIRQLPLLAASIVIYLMCTVWSLKSSQKRFENVDL